MVMLLYFVFQNNTFVQLQIINLLNLQYNVLLTCSALVIRLKRFAN